MIGLLELLLSDSTTTTTTTRSTTTASIVNGGWGSWGSWSACSRTCGSGTQSRTRSCDSPAPANGGDQCPGTNITTTTCNTQCCSVDGIWSSWTPWSNCSIVCGGGTSTRSRSCTGQTCGGKPCPGNNTESKSCNEECCSVDGVWTSWSIWSDCSKDCGGGTARRRRSCNGQACGGNVCPGNSNESKACNEQCCAVDGIWESWTPWSKCSKVCGGGTSSRRRSCTGQLCGGSPCPGNTNDLKVCNEQCCPVDGIWASWTSWSKCSKVCGGGTSTRTRSCNGMWCNGKPCPGSSFENRNCNEQCCPVDGIWASWTSWSTCSKTCGGGSSIRSRSCSGPTCGGKSCPGSSTENKRCNEGCCSVDGIWSSWTSWSACSKSCGGGRSTRRRSCSEESCGGVSCPGHNNEYKVCNEQCCVVSG